jgi:uncharacterized protein
LFRRFQFRVGVSIDGPPIIHDQKRVDKSGKPTYSRAISGLKALRDAGVLNGAIVVATDAIIGMGAGPLVAFCIEEGIKGISVLPVRPDPATAWTEPYIRVPDYVRFLLELDDSRQRLDGPTLAIREVDAARRALAGASPGYCELLGGCVGHFFSVDPDGSIWHCDKFTGELSYRLGNVLVNDLESICGGRDVAALREGAIRATSDYDGCPYYRLCRGWCPHEGFVGGKLGVGAPGCCGLRELFSGLEDAARHSEAPT